MNLINLIVGLSSLVLLLFSIHLFYVKSGNRYLNILLGLWLFSRFCDNTLYFLIDSGYIAHLPFFIKLFSPLSMLAPGISFLYVRGFITDQFVPRKKDWIHLVPGFLALVDALPWYFSSSINWSSVASEIGSQGSYIYNQVTGFLPVRMLFYAKNVLVLVYTGFIIRTMYIAGVFRKLKRDNIENIWLVFLTIVIFVPQMARFYVAASSNTNLHPHNIFSLFSLFSVLSLLSLIGMIGFLLYNPSVLYGFILVQKNTVLPGALTPHRNIMEKNDSIEAKFMFEKGVIEKYQMEMVKYMGQKKPYLSADFRIGQMALDINIPVHHCSYVLNFIIKKNFRDWINEYRIAHFIEQYGLKHGKMTIEAFASESGFSNHATFYNAFKKEIGITPKAYFALQETLKGS